MREIKIISTRGAGQPIVSNATTLNGILQDLTSRGINPNENSLIVKETRAELSLGEAILPEGNFTLFIYPKKNKSGAIEEDILDIQAKVSKILDKLNSMEISNAKVAVVENPDLDEYNELASSLLSGLDLDDDEDEDDDF